MEDGRVGLRLDVASAAFKSLTRWLADEKLK
jgi:hypothetical protein